jgi:hypothetical protein
MGRTEMQMNSINSVVATVPSPPSTPVASATRSNRASAESNPEFQVARDPDTDEFIIFVRNRDTGYVDFQAPAEDIVEMGVSVGLNGIL